MPITKYNNILSDELYQETIEYITSLMKKEGQQFTTSMLNWEDGLIENSAPILKYDFYAYDDEFRKKIKREIETKIPYFIDGFMLYVWPNSSYITWHDDGMYKAGLTIYLNEKWDSNWGGYLMYEENEEIKAIKPEKNLGVLQENGVNHMVTTINVGANLRTTLQFFLTKKKKML